MKKILLAAVAALAIVGCSQNEEIEKAGEKAEINFGTVVSNDYKSDCCDIILILCKRVVLLYMAYNDR